MGERKGTNKYYPPDYDPKSGGLNKFLGTHALRERARKIHMGIIIIRFEMPYNIWCEGCNNHIGMGVRYNAEKKKVGMYYTTPVYEFKMKCHLCDNHFVIKTDPANLDYVILSGARRQENRWDPTKNEQVVPETKETQKRLFDDSMFKLEHGSEDQNTAANQKPRLIKLYDRNESTWSDHYTSNQKLRESFRKRRRTMRETAEDDQSLLKKSSLDIPLLPEREEDKKYASLLSKIPCRNSLENNELQRKVIISTPALPSSNLNFVKEQKALRIIKSAKKNLGIVPKNLKVLKLKDTHKEASNHLSNILNASNKTSNEVTDDCDYKISNVLCTSDSVSNSNEVAGNEYISSNKLSDKTVCNGDSLIETNAALLTNNPQVMLPVTDLESENKATISLERNQDDKVKQRREQKCDIIDKVNNSTGQIINSLSLLGEYGSSSDTD